MWGHRPDGMPSENDQATSAVHRHDQLRARRKIDPAGGVAVSASSVWIAGAHCGNVVRQIDPCTDRPTGRSTAACRRSAFARLRLALGVGPRREVAPARRPADPPSSASCPWANSVCWPSGRWGSGFGRLGHVPRIVPRRLIRVAARAGARHSCPAQEPTSSSLTPRLGGVRLESDSNTAGSRHAGA